MIVVSPWTRGGWVCSRGVRPHLADPLHRAALRRRQRRRGTSPTSRRGAAPCAATWSRRSTSRARTTPCPRCRAPPATCRRTPTATTATCRSPPTVQAMPKQEPGLKWSRALPYDLAAHGQVDSAQAHVPPRVRQPRRRGRRVPREPSPAAPTRRAPTRSRPGKRLDDSWTTVTASGSVRLRRHGARARSIATSPATRRPRRASRRSRRKCAPSTAASATTACA